MCVRGCIFTRDEGSGRGEELSRSAWAASGERKRCGWSGKHVVDSGVDQAKPKYVDSLRTTSR